MIGSMRERITWRTIARENLSALAGGHLLPEEQELLLEEVRSDALEVVLREIGELVVPAIAEVLRLLEQTPTIVLQEGLIAVLLASFAWLRPRALRRGPCR